MTITANALPSVVPQFALPLDAATQFASAQTLTATGYINNVVAQIDLGAGVASTWGAGRVIGMLALDVTALKISAGNEAYQLALLGSNDVNFGNANVDLLAYHDFAATAALRTIPAICGINLAVPPTNLSGTVMGIPYTNLMQRIVFRYLKLYAIIAGTLPSITLSAWLCPLEDVC